MPSPNIIEAPPAAELAAAFAFSPRIEHELAHEVEALRAALKDRESTLALLRVDLEEQEAALEWREHEVRAAAAEATAAKRESTQYREDRDYLRRQLQMRLDELSTVIGKFRAERVRSAAAEKERDELESSLRSACDNLLRELAQGKARLAAADAEVRSLADEVARLERDSASQAATNAAGRELQADLARRLQERAAHAPPGPSTPSGDKTAEWTEIARLRAEVTSLKAALAHRAAGDDDSR